MRATLRDRVLHGVVCSIAILLAVCAGVALGGCSRENPEQEIRADLTANFDEIKEFDEATVSEISSGMDASAFEAYGIAPEDVVRLLLDGFDYEIGSVSVDEDGKTATAEVSVTCKSASGVSDAAAQAATELMEEILTDPSGAELLSDEDAMNARIGQVVLAALDALEIRETTVEVPYAKTDGVWQVSGSSWIAGMFQ